MEIKIEFDEECYFCNGAGFKTEWQTQKTLKGRNKKVAVRQDCKACQGKGKKLTEFGRNLLKFMDDYSPFENRFVGIESNLRDLNRDPMSYD